jgi:hypothetical protein
MTLNMTMGPLPDDYGSWSASRKQSFLWTERILKTKYETLPPLKKIDIPGLFLTALKKKMDRQSDESPADWKKAIHAHGSVAQVKFVPVADTPFTGLFKGAEHGFLRISVTADPSDRGVAPGLALKLLVDGKPSGNVSLLVSLTGQGKNHNLFANEYSNIVPVVKSVGPLLINLIFARVTKYPTKLSLEDMSEFDQHGKPVAKKYHPAQLYLVPNSTLGFSEMPHDFRTDMAKIPIGTAIFEVFGVDPEQADEKLMGQPEYRDRAQLIGHLVTTSDFVASSYGDSQLFFRHQRFRDR